MPKEFFREPRQPLFLFPSKYGVLGGAKDFWVCWDNCIALMHRRSWLGRLLRRHDEPRWGPAFYDQIEEVRVVPHLGDGYDELIIIFKNGKPLSLKGPRKNIESVRSVILPRLHVR